MSRTPTQVVVSAVAALFAVLGGLTFGATVPGKERVTMSNPEKTPPASFHEEAAMPYDPDGDAAAGSSAIEGVRRRHEGELLGIPGVTGVAVGRSPIGDDAIVVYLRDASVKGRVPTQVEGYPVLTTVTGEIDAY